MGIKPDLLQLIAITSVTALNKQTFIEQAR